MTASATALQSPATSTGPLGCESLPVGIEDQCCIDENAGYLSHLSGKAILQLVTMPP